MTASRPSSFGRLLQRVAPPAPPPEPRLDPGRAPAAGPPVLDPVADNGNRAPSRAQAAAGVTSRARLQESDVIRLLRLVWRRKLLLILAAVVCGGGAYGASLLQAKTYASTADVVLETGSSVAGLAGGGLAESFDVPTEIQLVTSAQVQAAVARTLGGPAPAVQVGEVGTTRVVAITASAGSGARAAAVANAYADSFIAFLQTQAVDSLLSAATVIQQKISALEAQISSTGGSSGTGGGSGDSSRSGSSAASGGTGGGGSSTLQQELSTYQSELSQVQLEASLQTGEAELTAPAVVPPGPSSPKPKRNAAAGFLVGLVLAAGAVLLRDYFDDAVYGPGDLEDLAAEIPVLAVIPSVGERKRKTTVAFPVLTAPSSVASEAYRQLRTSLQFADLDSSQRVIQVTSSVSAEGKTTTAVNLAAALGQTGVRTVLIDADLRRPRIHTFFRVPNQRGLTDALGAAADIGDLVVAVPDMAGLFVLTSGRIPSSPAELLSSPRLGALLMDLRGRFDYVVLDSPPVLPVADASILAGQVEGTIIVARAGSTSRRSLDRALDSVLRVGGRPAGFVLNDLPFDRRGYGYGYGYGGYGYGSRYGYASDRSDRHSDTGDHDVTAGTGASS